MNRAIAKLTRENHLSNLISGLPLLTALYGLNCILMYNFIEGLNVGSFALYLGAMLITFVVGLFIYDKYHHVLLYNDHLLIYFQPLQLARKVEYKNIQEIITPEHECEFSSMLIKLKNDQVISLHFIDYPQEVKKVIIQMIVLNEDKQIKSAA